MALDTLRDGFVQLCFDPSANVAGTRGRMIVEGPYYDPGLGCNTIPNQLVRVTNVRDLQCQFGDSVLASSLRKAIECCGNGAVDIFALPRQDVVGSVAAEYTITVGGPATSDGRVDIFIGEASWGVSVRVLAGDTADSIAAAIAADLAEDFPYTATVVGNVITLVANNAGSTGNFLQIINNWQGRNNYAPQGVDITAVQTVVGSGDYQLNDYEAIYGECCVVAHVLQSNNDTQQDYLSDYLKEQWECDRPQCFGHGYVYNAGALGEILANDTNTEVLSRLAHCNTDPILPWLKNVAYAAQSACLTVDNPEISIQGQNFGVLGCLREPGSCGSCLTYAEQVQLRDSGFVVTVPTSSGVGSYTSPMITNDVTNNRFDAEGRENYTFQSTSSRRLSTTIAIELSKQVQQFNGLAYFTNNTQIRQGTQGVNRKMMLGQLRVWAKSQIGVLFSEFDDIDKDIVLQDDFEIAPRCLGEPGKMSLMFSYRQPVRVRSFKIEAIPRLVDNC